MSDCSCSAKKESFEKKQEPGGVLSQGRETDQEKTKTGVGRGSDKKKRNHSVLTYLVP